jgi:hypothetical protein
MPTRTCSKCGEVCEGGADPKCSAGGAHRWDRIGHERAESAERAKKKEADEVRRKKCP